MTAEISGAGTAPPTPASCLPISSHRMPTTLKKVHVCKATTLPEVLSDFWSLAAQCAQEKYSAMAADRDYTAHVLFVVPRCDLLKDYGMMRHMVSEIKSWSVHVYVSVWNIKSADVTLVRTHAHSSSPLFALWVCEDSPKRFETSRNA